MKPSAIKSLLIENEIKQRTIAQNLSVSRGTVSGVINGHTTSKRIQKYIARLLHLPYRTVWEKAA
jgi:predicted XRE-type DNA-binding protein